MADKSDKADMLNISDLVRETGMNRGALVRLLAIDSIREWLGGKDTHPLYPKDRLDLFFQMKTQHDRGIKPAAFAIAIEDLRQGEQFASGAAGSDVAVSPAAPELPYAPAAIEDMGRLLGGGLAQVLIEQLRVSQLLPPPEDRLLDRDAAAALLACSPASVGRRVRSVAPGAWSYLDIQAYIADLRKIAHAKPPRSRKPAVGKTAE